LIVRKFCVDYLGSFYRKFCNYSPLQALPGPASVQSSTSDTETLKSEQDSIIPETSHEAKTIITGKDGKTPKKIHKPEELKAALMPVLDRLFYLDPEGMPFREPVNPSLLGIPVRHEHSFFPGQQYPMPITHSRQCTF
jgi:hypothetical protein